MRDLWHSRYQVFIVVCDVWWLWKCSWKCEVFTDFLICTTSSLIEECDECACLRLMSRSSDWCWAGERNMPLGTAKNFLIDGKATFSNSQKMSLLNSWLAQGKSWADIPPAIKWHAKTEFKIPSALYGWQGKFCEVGKWWGPPHNHWRWRQGFHQHSRANTRTRSSCQVCM